MPKPKHSANDAPPATGLGGGALLGFLLLLGITLWLMTRAWDASLLDRFQFRQTQTALSAYWMQQEGFHFAYLTPIFGPPWSVPYEFPLYQWLVASFSTTAHISLLSAARAVGIIFFLIALPAIYGLASLIEPDSRRRLLIPAAVLTAPVCLFYSRAFMIESCACSLAVWFLYAHIRSLKSGSSWWAALTLATGILAALVKVTTFALFGLAAFAYTLYWLWGKVRSHSSEQSGLSPLRGFLTSALTAIIILTIARSWIGFTDSIKQTNAFAASLTSEKLQSWHFGTIHQRIDPEFWRIIAHNYSEGALSLFVFLLIAFGLFLIPSIYRRAAIICGLWSLTGPLLFSNLYAVHEYYYFSTALIATASVGIVLAGLCSSQKLGRSIKFGFLFAFLFLQGANFYSGYGSTLFKLPEPPPAFVNLIQEAVPADEVVVIYGWDWNTLIPYYAQRRVILIPFSEENNNEKLEQVLSSLGEIRIAALVMAGTHKEEVGFIRWRTQKLGLAGQPIASSSAGNLYLRPDLIPAFSSKFSGQNIPDVALDFNVILEPLDPRLKRRELIASEYSPVTSHPPIAIYSQWGVQVDALAGQLAIFTNAPTELHFAVPNNATRINAVVGMNEQSHLGASPTDGIEVVIFERKLDGSRRVIYQRYLDQLNRPDDRGEQLITIDHIGSATGPLVFALYAGPSGNMACDWGYWRYIKFK